MKSRFALFSIFGLSAISACSAQSGRVEVGDGSAEVLAVTSSALTTADIARVGLTISGDGINPALTSSLAHVGNNWKGVIGGIPAGDNREFLSQAYDGSNTVIFTDDDTGVSITKGGKAFVALILQQTDAAKGNPFSNSAPIITSAFASANSVAPGDTISVKATATDPDQGDTLTYAWSSSPGGNFAASGSAQTTWTAPTTEGPVTLTLRVHDQKGASAAISFAVNVQASAGTGSASISASFNDAPAVDSIVADPTPLQVDVPTQLGVTWHDVDGDPIKTYAWTSSCTGSFSDPAAAAPTFTLSDPTATSCALSVTLTDARGGFNSGQLSVAVGAPASVATGPVVDSTFASGDTAGVGTTITFRAKGEDAAGDTVRYTWDDGGAGTLATPTTTPDGSSEIVWTSPGCSTEHETVSVTMTADVTGASTTYAFDVAPDASCSAAPTWLFQRLNQSTALVAADNFPLDYDVSANGQFVVFSSQATNLTDHLISYAPGGRTPSNVFLHDRSSGETTLVSYATGSTKRTGATGDNDSFSASITANGQYAIFYSGADNLVASSNSHIYRRDLNSGDLSVIDVRYPGAGCTGGYCRVGTIYDLEASSDGSAICFSTYDPIDPGDTNGLRDVYWVPVFDPTNIHRLSTVGGGANSCALSSNGYKVAFTDFVTANGPQAVYMVDFTKGTSPTLLSGTDQPGFIGRRPISADGSRIVFQAYNALTADGSTGNGNIFLWDSNAPLSRVSKATPELTEAQLPSISSDGQTVTFMGSTGNVVDVYAWSAATGLKIQTQLANGSFANANSGSPIATANGDGLVFYSYASNLDDAPAGFGGLFYVAKH